MFHAAQRFEDAGQVGGKLRHRLAEFGDFLPLITEKQRDEMAELLGVAHVAARDLLAILDQDDDFRILENNIVLRVALAQLFGDSDVEIVGAVLGLPIAERLQK